MNERVTAIWQRVLAFGLLPFLLLGCSIMQPPGAAAQERTAIDRQVARLRIDHLASGYTAGGSLGFRLIDTSIQEQLYRRADRTDRGLLWSAQFVSRWPLNEDQLDRWSAQVGGLVTDELGTNVRLAGWERMAANDIGDQRVAYRYNLATETGERVGEATIVVFAQGNQVGLTAAATLGGTVPVDASNLARMMLGTASS